VSLHLKNGVWHWRKMIDGVTFYRSIKTDDRKHAATMAKKWEPWGVWQPETIPCTATGLGTDFRIRFDL
jgi:hypothetical protein